MFLKQNNKENKRIALKNPATVGSIRFDQKGATPRAELLIFNKLKYLFNSAYNIKHTVSDWCAV